MRDIHLNDRYYFYDRGQIRPGANTKQKQLPDKASLDTKVEGWAVCFCFGNVTGNYMKAIFTIFLLLLGTLTFSQTNNDSIIALFGGQINGELTKEEILKADSVQIFFRSDKKDFKTEVLSFTIDALYTGMRLDISNNSNSLSDKQKEAILNRVAINQTLYIDDIIVKVNGKFSEVNMIKIKIIGPQLYLSDQSQGIAFKYRSILDSNDVRQAYNELFFNDSEISKSKFLENDFLMAGFDYQIDPKLQIIEYSFMICKGNNSAPITVKSDKITVEIKNIVKSLKKGDVIQFYEAKAVDESKKEHEIGYLRLTLTE